MKKRICLSVLMTVALMFFIADYGSAADSIAITGVNITPSRLPVQAGDPVNVTVNASSASASAVYYKFYYCGSYGTSDYERTGWTEVQGYSTSNTCNYIFPASGSYVIVARAVTDPANEPAALPVVGGVVTVGGNDDTVNISSFSSTATPSLKAGESVNLALNASTVSDDPVYYKFFYCASYGTSDYAATAWTTVQEYSASSSSRYLFPDAGNYIVVARAVTDPASEPSALPIFGGMITVNSPSGTTASDSTADAILNSTSVTGISLNGDSITVNGPGATSAGSTVTITSAGAYRISGTLNNGRILVNTEDQETVGIIFNGINISSLSTSPFYVMNAEKTVVVLAGDTENIITDGSSYIFDSAESDEPDAAMFSKDELTICGSGSLTVNGKYNDGIASKDGLEILNGDLNVNSVDDGIRGKDFLVVKGGRITVNATGDGLKSDNDEDTEKGYIAVESGILNITSGGDAFDAETSVRITEGTVNISSGGGSSRSIAADASAKGIKGVASVTIDGGNININSADDAIHSNGSITVNGGTFALSSGDDGIHADTSLIINGGNIGIPKSYEGIESAAITLNNGNIHIVSSDDGINGAGGNDGSGMVPGPGITPVTGTIPETGTIPDNGTVPGTGTRPGSGTMPGTGTMPGQDTFTSSGNYCLYINGGYIVVDAAGDGIDINGSIEMADGVVIVNGPTSSANGALDYDGSFRITGGFLVAAGSAGMVQAPGSTSTLNSVLLNFNSARQAGTLVHIQTATGNGILTFAPSKAYQSLVLSSPELLAGTAYDVYLGGSSTGTVTDSIYENGSYTPGTKYSTFTVSGVVTTVR